MQPHMGIKAATVAVTELEPQHARPVVLNSQQPEVGRGVCTGTSTRLRATVRTATGITQVLTADAVNPAVRPMDFQ